VTFSASGDRLWNFDLVLGGQSLVAMLIAWRSWRQFQDALKPPGTRRTEPLSALTMNSAKSAAKMSRDPAGSSTLGSLLIACPCGAKAELRTNAL